MKTREERIKELMTSIRKNTQASKCIDVFESLLKEIPDDTLIEDVISDMHSFLTEFFKLCKDVDNMKNLSYKSKILTYDFIQPMKFFSRSRKIAELYLMMDDLYGEGTLELPKRNFLGDFYHRTYFSRREVLNLVKYFDCPSKAFVEENSRKAVLLYNYLPAIVKALLQTKRRSLGLDKNSKKFS